MPIIGAIPNVLTAEQDVSAAQLNTNFQYIADQVNTNVTTGGSGQMLGTAAVKAISFNSQTIAENLTIAAGTNGGSFGPITINDGFTVTVSDGSVWSIV